MRLEAHQYYPDLPCWCGGMPAFGKPHRFGEEHAPGDAAGGHGARGEPGTGPSEPTETAADRPERGSGR